MKRGQRRGRTQERADSNREYSQKELRVLRLQEPQERMEQNRPPPPLSEASQVTVVTTGVTTNPPTTTTATTDGNCDIADIAVDDMVPMISICM